MYYKKKKWIDDINNNNDDNKVETKIVGNIVGSIYKFCVDYGLRILKGLDHNVKDWSRSGQEIPQLW